MGALLLVSWLEPCNLYAVPIMLLPHLSLSALGRDVLRKISPEEIREAKQES